MKGSKPDCLQIYDRLVNRCTSYDKKTDKGLKAKPKRKNRFRKKGGQILILQLQAYYERFIV
jgi:hypothetical protein